MIAPTYSIAVVGAGPAGLTLARLLHSSSVCNVHVTIFERDLAPTSRVDQGGTLDLHHDTGLAAIRKCGLWDVFTKHASYEGEELILTDKNATTIIHKGGRSQASAQDGAFDRPEIDRQKLKEILLKSIPEEIVKWNHHLQEVLEDGTLKFHGREEVEGPYDLVVGADGAWSKIRAKLTDVKPRYSGVSGYEMEISNPSVTCPQVDKMVGRGSYVALSDCLFLGAQRMSNNSLKIRSWSACPEDEAKETLKRYGKAGTQEKIARLYTDWAPAVTELLKQGDAESMHVYTLYELPVGTRWEHRRGYTLIGDAASLMTPFSGEGVNKAMKDCLELADRIEMSCASGRKESDAAISLDQAVDLYEKEMFPRATKHQEETIRNKQVFFSPDAPIRLLTGLLQEFARESSSFSIRMLGSAPVVAILYSFLWIRIQIGWGVRTYWRRD
jgi:2-polyprenyl-6-methoxyphenol hydroxylase-like FAD-dependent oxidoreductase